MIELKNKIVLLGSVLFLLTLSSCKVTPSPVPNIYELFLEFRDKNDVNLLNDFDINNFKTDIIIKTDKGEVLKGDYLIIESSNKKILKILSSTLPDNKVNVLTYTIQNEELIGNADKRILEAKWIFSNNNNVLNELSINGDKISPIKENHFSYYVLTKG